MGIRSGTEITTWADGVVTRLEDAVPESKGWARAERDFDEGECITTTFYLGDLAVVALQESAPGPAGSPATLLRAHLTLDPDEGVLTLQSEAEAAEVVSFDAAEVVLEDVARAWAPWKRVLDAAVQADGFNVDDPSDPETGWLRPITFRRSPTIAVWMRRLLHGGGDACLDGEEDFGCEHRGMPRSTQFNRIVAYTQGDDFALSSIKAGEVVLSDPSAERLEVASKALQDFMWGHLDALLRGVRESIATADAYTKRCLAALGVDINTADAYAKRGEVVRPLETYTLTAIQRGTLVSIWGGAQVDEKVKALALALLGCDPEALIGDMCLEETPSEEIALRIFSTDYTAKGETTITDADLRQAAAEYAGKWVKYKTQVRGAVPLHLSPADMMEADDDEGDDALLHARNWFLRTCRLIFNAVICDSRVYIDSSPGIALGRWGVANAAVGRNNGVAFQTPATSTMVSLAP